MSRISAVCLEFLRDVRGVVTAEWMAVMATFVILGIGTVYAIFGDDDEGLIAVVNSKQEQLAERADHVTDLLSEVDSWTPGGS